MNTRAVAVAVLLLAFAPAASARSNVPAPPRAVHVIRAYCPGGYGVACTEPDGVTIYLAPTLTGAELEHELGHAFDFQVMGAGERAAFAGIFGRTYDAATYWQASGQDDSLAEWFAEGYRVCALYPRYRGLSSVDELRYDYSPTRAQQRHVCALIRYAGALARAR